MTDDYWIWMTVAFPLMIALSCFIFAFLTRRIFAWLLKLGSLRRLAKITAITYLVLGIIYGLLALMLLAFEESLKESALAKAVLITCLFLILPLTFLIYCLLTIFAARGLAYLASGIFYTGEFIVRRIAEYPKRSGARFKRALWRHRCFDQGFWLTCAAVLNSTMYVPSFFGP